MSDQSTYNIPAKFRSIENLHVLLWLLKDIAWCMEWRNLGLMMILPTFGFALYLTLSFWHIISERCHNIAILLWISANGYWMILEFFGWDEIGIGFGYYTLRHITLIPFILGILSMLYYYIWWKPRHKFNPIPETVPSES